MSSEKCPDAPLSRGILHRRFIQERPMSALDEPKSLIQDLTMPKRSPHPVMPTAGEHEWLEILWRLGEGTIEDILRGSGQIPAPNYKTVQTLLRIMERKRLVVHRLQSRDLLF